MAVTTLKSRHLTPSQVAGELGVTPATVRRWLLEGRLDGLVVGGRYRVDPAAVQVFVRAATDRET